VEPPDVEPGDPGQLVVQFPSVADTIRRFTYTG
jgi:hypothetical protein